jgi:hypothetical protein
LPLQTRLTAQHCHSSASLSSKKQERLPDERRELTARFAVNRISLVPHQRVYKQMYRRLQPLYEEIRRITGYPPK